LKILRQVLNSIADHARRSFPRECCGILMCLGEDGLTVNRALWAENASPERPEQRYLLGHEAHLKAVEMESAGDARIAGYYHSHPDGKARPSNHDVEQAISGVTYLITGLESDGQVEHTAWRLEGDNLVPEPLEVCQQHEHNNGTKTP